MVVQRLSDQWSGKTPKFCPIGPREFVPYLSDDFTLDCIKSACIEHFKKIDVSVNYCECDVLATVYGPTCINIDHIPNINLIYVKFVSNTMNTSMVSGSIHSNPEIAHSSQFSKIAKIPAMSLQLLQPKQKRPKILPSLSLSAMMKIGKVVNDSLDFIEVKVKEFHLDSMMWNEVSDSIKFSVNKEKFGSGTFRNVYKVSSSHVNFRGEWLMKRYNLSTIKTITEDYHQSLEQHTKKVVQMTNLAAYFAEKLSQAHEDAPKFRYVDIYLGELKQKSEFVTIERLIKGEFIKYMNNDGQCDKESELAKKAECLAHFSFEKSNESLLLTDIQGCGEILTDPEIASANLAENKELLFCIGNYCRKAIKCFGLSHECNSYCQLVGLNPLELAKFETYDDTIEFPEFSKVPGERLVKD